MKKAMLLVSLFLLSLTSPLLGASSGQSTNAGEMEVLHTAVNPANNHTYHLLSASDWENSASFARSLGGFLTTVDDEAENTWLFDTFSSYDNQSRHLWTGLNDANMDGQYRWHDGTPFLYRNWGDAQPSEGGDEDYVHIASTNMGNIMPGTWNDLENNPQYFPVYGIVEVGPGADFSLRFDGENDHVIVPHDDNLSVTANLTLTAWVFPYALEGQQFIAMKGDYGWGMYLNGGNLAYASEYSLSRHPVSNLTVTVGEWNHVMVTIEDGVGGGFSINGHDAGNISAEEAMIPNGDFGSNDCFTEGDDCDEFYIGRMGAGCDCNHFGGLIDNVSVNGLQSQWMFSEGEGNLTADNTGRQGTIIGADWVMPDGSIVAQAVELFQNEDYLAEELLEGSTYLFFTEIEAYTRSVQWNAFSFGDEDQFGSSYEVYVAFDRIPSEWDHDEVINTQWGYSYADWSWPEEGTMWFVLVPQSDMFDFNIFLQSQVADPPPTLDEMTELQESIAITNQELQGQGGWNGEVAANYYYVNVTAPLADLRIQTYGGRGDVDLAISSYSPPDPENGFSIGLPEPADDSSGENMGQSTVEEDWSTGQGNDEEVHLFNVEPGIYYITAYSWRNARQFTIVADFVYQPENVEPSDAIVLTPGVEYGLLSGYDGLSQYFKVNVSTGTERLVVDLNDGDGEAALYMRQEQAPTPSTFDHHSTMEGAEDRIAFNDPTPGWWYILLTTESAFTGVNIVAEFADRYVWDYDGTPIELYNDERLDGISTPEGETVSFFVNLEEPGNILQITTSGGSGDLQVQVEGQQYEFDFFDGFFPGDLFTDGEETSGRQGRPNMEVDPQDVSITSGRTGTNHVVTIELPLNGRFDIDVTGISDSEEYSIVATWDRSDFPIEPVDPVLPEQPTSTDSCIEQAEREFAAQDLDESGLLETNELGMGPDDPITSVGPRILMMYDANEDGVVEYREYLQVSCACENELRTSFDALAIGQGSVALDVFEAHDWLNSYSFDLVNIDDDTRLSSDELELLIAVCETTYDAFDGDGDGVPDEEDAFPDDPDESRDTDGDGVGDNADFAASVSNDVIYTSFGVVFAILVIALLGMFVRSNNDSDPMATGKSWDDELRLEQAINAPSMTDLPLVEGSSTPLVESMPTASPYTTPTASPYDSLSVDANAFNMNDDLISDLTATSPAVVGSITGGPAPDPTLMGMMLDGVETVEFPPESGQLWIRTDMDAPWNRKEGF